MGKGILIMNCLTSSNVGEGDRSGISKEIGLTFPMGSKATLSKSGLCISRVGSAKFKKTFPMDHGAVLDEPGRVGKLP